MIDAIHHRINVYDLSCRHPCPWACPRKKIDIAFVFTLVLILGEGVLARIQAIGVHALILTLGEVDPHFSLLRSSLSPTCSLPALVLDTFVIVFTTIPLQCLNTTIILAPNHQNPQLPHYVLQDVGDTVVVSCPILALGRGKEQRGFKYTVRE